MKKVILTTLALVSVCVAAEGKVKPASLIGDNMVLQQKADARLWGTATPGAEVTVTPSWDNKKYTVKADKEGQWNISVATPEGSFTPYSITISDGEQLTLSNVLVGEVWLASGQSNMQMTHTGIPR
ncbi:MAG: hypothetical protein K2I12_00470 [Duncaniella sp.]|nr:hypothetical protein [Duncaniella sp.]